MAPADASCASSPSLPSSSATSDAMAPALAIAVCVGSWSFERRARAVAANVLHLRPSVSSSCTR